MITELEYVVHTQKFESDRIVVQGYRRISNDTYAAAIYAIVGRERRLIYRTAAHNSLKLALAALPDPTGSGRYEVRS